MLYSISNRLLKEVYNNDNPDEQPTNVGHSEAEQSRELRMSPIDTAKEYSNEIDETIVDIDAQLEGLCRVPVCDLQHRITLIKGNFHKLFNFLKGCDIEKFAYSEPSDKTPLNSECGC